MVALDNCESMRRVTVPRMAAVLCLAIALISVPGLLRAQETALPALPAEQYDDDCLPLHIEGRHGPFDYRRATAQEKTLVEAYHFVEHFRGYQQGKIKITKVQDGIIEYPAAGFSYTLWAFPNHPQALLAMEDLSRRFKTDRPPGSQLRVHCYFQRAVRFVPDDGLVRALYGYYYARRKLGTEAEAELAAAQELSPSDVNVQLYLAWSYIELGKANNAAVHAKRAYELGYPLPGLREKLKKAGQSID